MKSIQEMIKSKQEIQEMINDCVSTEKNCEDGLADIYKGWIEGLKWVQTIDEQPESDTSNLPNLPNSPNLPDGLQKYIDGVALNILYSNYPKSTVGIWSTAGVEFYEVNIDFGYQDDTHNEQYSDTIYVYHNGTEWCYNKQ